MQSHSADALEASANAFSAELKISPEDSGCEFQLGQIAEVRGNTNEAQQHFERALKLSPNFVTAMVALATLDVHAGKYDAAISLLNRAVQLQPANESAHYALLTAYRNAGQTEKAKAEKATLERLQKPPEGEFSDFLKKLGDKQPSQQ
jgi:tetratricopeptide (TPR) repeat protein